MPQGDSATSVFPLPGRVALEHVRRGRTLTRAALSQALVHGVRAHGRVLDLGGGPGSSYRPLLTGPDVEVTSVDLDPANAADLQLDLERDRLPLPDASFDVVLAFNLLEHLFDHRHLLDEAHRVLAPGGTVHVWVPFLIGYHPDPQDHFRYTPETLLRLLREAGFAGGNVIGYGGRFTAAANLVLGGLPGRATRLAVTSAGLLTDRLYYRVARSSTPAGFALGYLATGTRAAS